MLASLPIVEVVTPTWWPRLDKLRECHRRIEAQTYVQDFGGVILHTVVQDGPHSELVSGCRYLFLDGPHMDHGLTALDYGVRHSLTDLVMGVADDEWLEDTCIQKLVQAHQEAFCDFAIVHRRCLTGGDSVVLTGTPPSPLNLTTGLFKRSCWDVADSLHGPSGYYPGSGGDGVQAWDWLKAGLELVVVPEVLSTVQQN